MRVSTRWFAGLARPLLLLASGLPWGTVLAADLAQLPVLIDARIVDQRSAADIERTWPLGSVRKISGQLRIDGQIVTRGESHSTLYELPPEHSAMQAFDAVREAWQADGAQILFWCQARDCGESSLWANEIFANARLFGSDDQQAFMLLRQDDTQLLAIYSITGGNRRAYVQIDSFTAGKPLGEILPTPATVLRELRSTGELDYPSLTGAPAPSWVQLLARSLNQDYTLRVSLSGHAAEDWLQALVGAGVRPARLETVASLEPGLHIQLIR